jgi:agmatinase
MVALRTLEQMHKVISGRTANSLNVSQTPHIITLGGDHITTLPALRSIKENWGKVTVIHIDSHLDTWDPKIIGGTLSEYAGYNHGTFLSHAHSEDLILNTSVHLSTRARVSNPLYDLNYDRSYGFLNIPTRDINSIRVDSVIKKIKG